MSWKHMRHWVYILLEKRRVYDRWLNSVGSAKMKRMYTFFSFRHMQNVFLLFFSSFSSYHFLVYMDCVLSLCLSLSLFL